MGSSISIDVPRGTDERSHGNDDESLERNDGSHGNDDGSLQKTTDLVETIDVFNKMFHAPPMHCYDTLLRQIAPELITLLAGNHAIAFLIDPRVRTAATSNAAASEQQQQEQHVQQKGQRRQQQGQLVQQQEQCNPRYSCSNRMP